MTCYSTIKLLNELNEQTIKHNFKGGIIQRSLLCYGVAVFHIHLIKVHMNILHLVFLHV